MLVEMFSENSCKILLEPGRSLVSDSGLLVSKVVYKKQGEESVFLIIDAAMASTYNTRLLIPEVLVKDDQYSVIKSRTDYDELINQGQSGSISQLAIIGFVIAYAEFPRAVEKFFAFQGHYTLLDH